jgi:serine protease Do
VTTRSATWRRFLILPLALALGLLLTEGRGRLSGEEAAAPLAGSTAGQASSGTPDVQARSDAKATAKPLVTVSKNTPASAEDLATIQAAIQQAVEKALPATVGVAIRGTFGSGVIVTEDGYVLTAGHVAAMPGRDATIIFPNGKKVKAKTLGMNYGIDSGMLKITDEGKWPHVEMGRSADLKLGQWCVTLGHPGGLVKDRPPVVRAGRVLYTRDDAIATDCTLVGGDSGGPLLDMSGRVIGIHSRISDDVIDNYHVPIDTFRDTWDRLAKGEAWGGGSQPTGPLLGINGQSDPRGCLITNVFRDSAADKAGLKADDIITDFAGDAVKGLDGLQALLSKRKPGDEVKMTVRRGEDKLELTAKLTRRE